jgi:hypothetical protein
MKFKIVLAIILISTCVTPSAQAADKGYRYWGYFQAAPNKTMWTAAMTGPTVDIADGSVEGWSFVFSSDDIPSAEPRVKPDFKSICKGVKFEKDTKRIAVVIDFGSSSYSPKGEKIKKTITSCVRTAKESQGIDVLGQVTKIRAAGSGLICGLAGYPAKECGVEIPTPKALIKK